MKTTSLFIHLICIFLLNLNSVFSTPLCDSDLSTQNLAPRTSGKNTEEVLLVATDRTVMGAAERADSTLRSNSNRRWLAALPIAMALLFGCGGRTPLDVNTTHKNIPGQSQGQGGSTSTATTGTSSDWRSR